MKPQRMRITHELVQAYDMLPKMHVLVRSFPLDRPPHPPLIILTVPV